MKKTLMISILILGITTFTSFADEVSHRKSALKLLEVTRAEKMLDEMMTSYMSMMKLQLAMSGVKEADALEKEMMDWFSELYAWENIRDIFVESYIEVFSEDELNELIRFYSSPLGQKLLNKQPEVVKKGMQKMQVRLQEKMPEFQEKLKKRISEILKKK